MYQGNSDIGIPDPLISTTYGNKTFNLQRQALWTDFLRNEMQIEGNQLQVMWTASHTRWTCDCSVYDVHDPDCQCDCKDCKYSRDCQCSSVCECPTICNCKCEQCHNSSSGKKRQVDGNVVNRQDLLSLDFEENGESVEDSGIIAALLNWEDDPENVKSARRLARQPGIPKERDPDREYCQTCGGMLRKDTGRCQKCARLARKERDKDKTEALRQEKCATPGCKANGQVKFKWCTVKCYKDNNPDYKRCKNPGCDEAVPPGLGNICSKCHNKKHYEKSKALRG